MARLSMRRLAVTFLAAVTTSLVAFSPASPASAAPAEPDVKITFTVQPASAPMSAYQAGPYQVVDFQVAAINTTGQDFDEIWMAYNRVSNTLPQILKRAPFKNGTAQMFTVSNCSDINLYALGLIRKGSVVFNTGNIKPDYCNEMVQFS